MKKIKQVFNRASALIIAGIVTSSFVVPFIMLSSANAGTLEPREIVMSSSATSASDTFTAYITPSAASETIGGIVIDICSDTPLIGSGTCLYPAGFTFGAGTFANLNTTNLPGTWTVAEKQGGAGSGNYQTWDITDSTAQALPASASCSPANNCQISFTISGITNSSALGTFYARIITFDNATDAGTYMTAVGTGTSRETTVTGEVDGGGAALSTAQTINVTAKVFESLSFCVYDTSCGTAPNAILGANGTNALSTSYTYGDSEVSYALATNAYNGVSVTMTGTTLCSAVTLSYTNCENAASPKPIIAAIGTAPAAAAIDTPQFGMCVDVSNFGSSNLTPAATYKGNSASYACASIPKNTNETPGTAPLTSTSQFGFDDTNSTGTNSSGGSLLMSSTGPLSATPDTGYLTFIANVNPTTLAGVYQSNLNLVASAKF